MEENGELSAANKALEAREREKDEAERRLFVTTIYKTILSGLSKDRAATINGSEVLFMIVQAQESLSTELTWDGLPAASLGHDEWKVIQHKAKSLRKERLMEKGVHNNPSTEDLKEVSSELMNECREINKHAKEDISLMYENLTTTIFPGAKNK